MYCSNNLKISLDRFLATLYVNELEINTKDFNNSLSLKNQIIGAYDDISYYLPNNSLAFNVVIDGSKFSKIIHCEISSEYHRIKEQINNVKTLLSANNQAAWTVVTVYYACFFMGNLFSRLLGRTTINFSAENLKKIFTEDKFPVLSTVHQESLRDLKNGTNQTYTCLIERDQTESQVKIRLIPGGDKPHQAVWVNFNAIVNQVISKRSGSDVNELQLLKKIFDNSQKKFPLPSQLRNDWNYSDQKYFSNLGSDEARKFIHLLKDRRALEAWIAEQTKISKLAANTSTPEDKVCSLAFVYTVFTDIFNQLTNLEVNPNNSKIKIKLHKKRKK
jgi:hypothetical protein